MVTKNAQKHNGAGRPAKTTFALNERQEAFCHYIFTGKSATESAKFAGYSQRTAYSIGQRLLKHVEIQRRLAELKEAILSGRQMVERERREVLAIIARETHFLPVTARDRIAAIDTLNKLDRLYSPETVSPNQDNRVLNIFLADEDTKELIAQVKAKTKKLIRGTDL